LTLFVGFWAAFPVAGAYAGAAMAGMGIIDYTLSNDPQPTKAVKFVCFMTPVFPKFRVPKLTRGPAKPGGTPPKPLDPFTPTPPKAPPKPSAPKAPKPHGTDMPPRPPKADVPEVPPTPPKPPKTDLPEAPPKVVEPTRPDTKQPRCPANDGSGGKCFTAGVPLLTPDGYRLIETLREGDFVLSRDEHDVTGAVTPKVIEEIFRWSAQVLRLFIGRQVIGTTAEHPFYVRDHGWIEAGELWVGAELVGYDGVTTKVEAIEQTDEYVVVYNMRVADWHTYFVGAEDWGFSVWAHNTKKCIGDATGPYTREEAAYLDRLRDSHKSLSGDHAPLTNEQFDSAISLQRARASGERTSMTAEERDFIARSYAAARNTGQEIPPEFTGLSSIRTQQRIQTEAGQYLRTSGQNPWASGLATRFK
jgi:hypothetical protein